MTKQINISLPEDLEKWVREQAKAENRSISNFIANLLRQAVKEEE